ncbi:MAG: polysaccharide biosynthesis/export family protein [Deltaproteobacteria bacterium]|nr:polysaccharide biosynthesis/export family protein [Deltaproteobacteria bacterium]
MKTAILFFSVCVCLFAASCAPKQLRIQEFQVPQDAPNPAKPPDEFYVIGAGDVIGVHVWKEPSVSGAVKVRPDGYITIPLINEIQVTGLTTSEVRKILQDKYSEFLTDPYVTIRVEGIASTEVFLIGQAGNRAFPLSGNETILQLLTRAGGLGIFADRSNVRIVRRNGEKLTEFIVDYDAIIKGDLKQDILLRPGDRIIVP